MKNYESFIQESHIEIGSGSESIAKILNIKNPKLVIKKSHNKIYSDLMDKVHQMMSKKSDLFCRILKANKEFVITEKLDTLSFETLLVDSNQYLLEKIDKSEYYENLHKIFYDSLDDKFSCDRAKFFIKNNYKKYIKENSFVKNYIDIRLEIFDYFKNFIFENKKIAFCDLSDCNFGFIQGTKKIRCFDPVFIKN